MLHEKPYSGALFASLGKRRDLIKLLWLDGRGLCLFLKRMDRRRSFAIAYPLAHSIILPAQWLILPCQPIDPDQLAGATFGEAVVGY